MPKSEDSSFHLLLHNYHSLFHMAHWVYYSYLARMIMVCTCPVRKWKGSSFLTPLFTSRSRQYCVSHICSNNTNEKGIESNLSGHTESFCTIYPLEPFWMKARLEYEKHLSWLYWNKTKSLWINCSSPYWNNSDNVGLNGLEINTKVRIKPMCIMLRFMIIGNK